ncbi:MAG: DNA polymerase III subunit alpha [Planctomycetaceae bacterium]|nr:DNA polymerase III subunit alpha [Planctomycetaceae bacterium]
MRTDVAVSDFVHLRTHSHYSLLSAPCRIEDLVAAAASDGQRALALTDSGNLFGAIEFYKACCAADIKPILGLSAYCATHSRLNPSGPDNPTHHIGLLAATNEGWDNLKHLSSIAFKDGFHYRPRIDRDLLSQYSKGLIGLAGGPQSEIGQSLLARQKDEASNKVKEFAEILGRDNFYLELMAHDTDHQRQINAGMVEMHETLGLPIAATNNAHYLEADDWIAQDILLCIRNGRTVNDPNRFRASSRDMYLKTQKRMIEDFADHPDAIAQTSLVAERCHVDIDFNTYHLPLFETGSKETPEQMFDRLVEEGARLRYGKVTPKIRSRLDYETEIIKKLNFVSYFLITWDFLRHARIEGIPVGPGRGSAAGSIVAYCLKITDLDPIRYNLIFERFLNAERITMPDIDIDFCGERRDEVIDYVRNKYGEDNVSQIITFGTMASRGVLRDVGRVLETPLGDIDKIAKKVPQGPGASLKNALEEDRELQSIRDESPENARLFKLALKLEGLARHSSVHAAGVVIADKPLTEYVPLARNGDDITTQWQMNELEEVGLLKVDFLGLKTLTILAETTHLIAQTNGTEIDLEHLDLDDTPTYTLISQADTLGVFQLESSGMRDLLQRLRPDNFEDIIAVLALYRPGPLKSGMVDMFVRRKHKEEEVSYPDDSLKDILEQSYGVIVYQEQVMRTANVLAGFSMNEADSLRKAMGKKKPEVMAEFRDKFIEGATAKGRNPDDARKIFETVEHFAGYGFNRSHSAAYALLTYRTAWLKTHYQVEFMAANLTTESSNSDKIKEFVEEARGREIAVRPPDVNKSHGFFNVEDGGVRYGLMAIKGVGSRAAELVTTEREKNGPYASFEDFSERLDPSLVNKTAMEALVRSGAFDNISLSRRDAFESIDRTLRAAGQAREDKRKGQGTLFAPPDEETQAPAKPNEWSEADRLTHEKEALGFYLSGHPFEKRGRFFSRLAGARSTDIPGLKHGAEVRLAGMISSIKIANIRSGRNIGQKMARFRLEDLDGATEVTCFARQYQKVKDRLIDDSIAFISGTVDGRSETPTILIEDIQTVQDVVHSCVHGIVISLDEKAIQSNTLDRLMATAKKHSGEHRLMFDIADGQGSYKIRADHSFSVHVTDDLLDELAALVGPERLSFMPK